MSPAAQALLSNPPALVEPPIPDTQDKAAWKAYVERGNRVDAYRTVLRDYRPENIAVVGGSAGGGLAAASLLKVRDMGLPLPAACVLATPEVDLTESGDTFLSNTVRMHRALLRAGIEAELHVWEAMPHSGLFGAPEDEEVLAEHFRFIMKRLTKARG